MEFEKVIINLTKCSRDCDNDEDKDDNKLQLNFLSAYHIKNY
jgi:hypothetical protein